jgi:hypothetical protein
MCVNETNSVFWMSVHEAGFADCRLLASSSIFFRASASLYFLEVLLPKYRDGNVTSVKTLSTSSRKRTENPP